MREKSLASRRKEAVSLMHVGEPVRRYARSGFAANQTCAFFAPAIHSRRMCTLFRVSWQSDQVSMQQQKPAENQRLSLLFDVDDCWSLPIEPAQNRQPERLGSESTERRAR
jgi:hypothetical protein